MPSPYTHVIETFARLLDEYDKPLGQSPDELKHLNDSLSGSLKQDAEKIREWFASRPDLKPEYDRILGQVKKAPQDNPNRLFPDAPSGSMSDAEIYQREREALKNKISARVLKDSKKTDGRQSIQSD